MKPVKKSCTKCVNWGIVSLWEVRGQRFLLGVNAVWTGSSHQKLLLWMMTIATVNLFFLKSPTSCSHPSIHPLLLLVAPLPYFETQWWIQRQQSCWNTPAVCGNVLVNNGAENNGAAEWWCSRSRLENEWSHIGGQVPSTGSWRDCNSWAIISRWQWRFTVRAEGS